MKTVKLGIVCLVLSVLVLTGCDQLNRSTESSQPDNSVNAATVAKSNTSQSNDTAQTVPASKKTTDDHNFNFMVEGAQSQIPHLKKQYIKIYKDITIKGGKDHTVIYTYTFLKGAVSRIDSNALKPIVVKELKPAMDNVKTVVSDIKFQVIYLNTDGSEIANMLITQADTDAVK